VHVHFSWSMCFPCVVILLLIHMLSCYGTDTCVMPKMFLALEKSVNSQAVPMLATGVIFSGFYDITSLFGFRVFKVVSASGGSTSCNFSLSLNSSCGNFFGFSFAFLFGSLLATIVLVTVTSYAIVSFSCFYLFSYPISSQVTIFSDLRAASVNTLLTNSSVCRTIICASQVYLF